MKQTLAVICTALSESLTTILSLNSCPTVKVDYEKYEWVKPCCVFTTSLKEKWKKENRGFRKREEPKLRYFHSFNVILILMHSLSSRTALFSWKILSLAGITCTMGQFLFDDKRFKPLWELRFWNLVPVLVGKSKHCLCWWIFLRTRMNMLNS